ncbi:MAG: hypothetical protein PHS14_20100 [Elusimicrobia bacterium]|nr:hypothetical protein [Elusimicrobiota bacterium]
MTIKLSRALGVPNWSVAVAWPDGERLDLEVVADGPEEAEAYARDIWGASITTNAVPLEGR